MKKYIIDIVGGILIAACIFGACVCGFLVIEGLFEDIYYAKAQVMEVNGQVVTVMTADGNLWDFESERDYFVNETIKICFNTNGTETIYDDIIMGVR